MPLKCIYPSLGPLYYDFMGFGMGFLSLCFLFIYFFYSPLLLDGRSRWNDMALFQKPCVRRHHQKKKEEKKKGLGTTKARLVSAPVIALCLYTYVCSYVRSATAHARPSAASSAHRALGLVIQQPRSFSLAHRGPICINQNAEQMDGTAVALRCPPPSPSPV